MSAEDGDDLIQLGWAAFDQQLAQEATQHNNDIIMCNICNVKFSDAKNMFADLLLHFKNFHPHCMKADIQVNHAAKGGDDGDMLGLPPVPNIEEDYQDAADVVNQNIKRNDQGYGYDPRASLPGKYTTIYEVPVGLRQYLKRRALTSVEVLVKPYICIECGHLCTNLKTSLRHLCQNHNFILRGDHVWSQACRQHGFAPPKTSPRATIKSVNDDVTTPIMTSHTTNDDGDNSEENDDDVINKARHQRSLKRHHRSNDDVTKSDGSPPRKRNISTKFVLRGGTWMHADRLNQEKLAKQQRQDGGSETSVIIKRRSVGDDVSGYDVT